MLFIFSLHSRNIEVEASCDGCQLGLINAQKSRSSFSSAVLKENKNSELVSPLNIRKMGTSSLAM